jgi:hypothetical protein
LGGITLSIESHIEALREKHAAAEKQLRLLRQSPAPDSLVVRGITSLKLSLKDEISAAEKKLADSQRSESEPAPQPTAAAPKTAGTHEGLTPISPPYVSEANLIDYPDPAALAVPAQLPAACYGRIPKRA